MKNKKPTKLEQGNSEKKYLRIPASLIKKKMRGDEKLIHIALLMYAERKTEVHPSQQAMVELLERKTGQTVNDIRNDFMGLEIAGLIEFSQDRKTMHFPQMDAPPLAMSKMV